MISKGSSLTFSAQGGRGKEKIVSAKKSFCRSEDGSAGGGWGEECRAVRAKSAEPRRLLVQSRTPKKSFVFLLEEKIGRAQIKKCEQNFSVVWRALASGGGAVSLVSFPPSPFGLWRAGKKGSRIFKQRAHA